MSPFQFGIGQTGGIIEPLTRQFPLRGFDGAAENIDLKLSQYLPVSGNDIGMGVAHVLNSFQKTVSNNLSVLSLGRRWCGGTKEKL